MINLLTGLAAAVREPYPVSGADPEAV